MTTTPISPSKILLVDDDTLDRMVVIRALSRARVPFDVVEAQDYQEAIQLLGKQQFDCLILDYHLGGQDGLELIKEIHAELLSHAPIVILSGVDEEDTMLRCLKEGAQDYLLKSEITSNSLVRAINYSKERKQISLQMRFIAQHDDLTGLANRSLFIENLKRAIIRSKRDHSHFAVFFIDLDNFKSINDTLGHEAGDELLTIIGQRIQASIRGEDIVGRLGGDEFSVLIEGISDKSSLVKISQQLLDIVKEPVIIYRKPVQTTVSLGIATYPHCAHTAHDLIKCADMAMYKAKNSGRNIYHFYSESLQQLADSFAHTRSDLIDALDKNELELYYHPEINPKSGLIEEIEALIRWNHPTRGIIYPLDFMPIAETTGLMDDIGDWIIEEACKQLSTWLRSTKISNDLRLSVNISACQLRHQKFTCNIHNVLRKYQIPPKTLTLEFTEHTFIHDLSQAQQLYPLGSSDVRLSLDDFGTDYTSFRHLENFPLNKLKIDISVVNEVGNNEKSEKLIRSVIMMAHALDLTVVAEGIESKDQALILRDMECDLLQGFYFGKPLPANQMTTLLEHPDILAKLVNNEQPTKTQPYDLNPIKADDNKNRNTG
ncbi:hypothetical protein A9Q99_14835 [Gammaproteobacteria bacterium 45_16_T64]|nr:hypothetical protein A9Q99_14835 [Gammaproteobacteria bacterium 45_16_T64]